MPVRTVAIVGAGIAGLTAALAFARKGVAVDVIEKAPALEEVGAGLQIFPNASAVLDRLGVLPALEKLWFEPDRILLVSGSSLKPVSSVPSGTFARQRWHMPHGVLHRATLQSTLLAAVQANPLCRLYLGQQMDAASEADIVAVTGRVPDLVVGSDGVWSSLRRTVPGVKAPHFSGTMAIRFVLDSATGATVFDPTCVTALLGAKTHIVAYPLRETKAFNLVAILQGGGDGRSWFRSMSASDLKAALAAFSNWNPAIQHLLATAPNPTSWPLFQVADGPWHVGPSTVLIGDAAHAMTPFAAQGAAMAIEDAFELAAFATGAGPLAAALAAFEQHRRARIAKVRARGAFNRFAYHARGPVRVARDIVLSMRPPETLAGDLDWLYGYRALDEAPVSTPRH